MKSALLRFLRQWCLALAAVAPFAAGCGSHGGAPETAAAAKLKQDWKLQVKQAMQDAEKEGFSPKGGFYHQEVMLLDALLDQAPAAVVEAEFGRICASTVQDRWRSEDDLDKSYDHVLMVAFFDRTTGRKDEQRLRTLLSHHCPQYLGNAASEFYLASAWPEAIECFFDCYTAAKSAGIQKNIVSCLGRAFPALRDRFPADREFVQQARSWYTSNRNNLQVNHRYVHVAAQEPAMPGVDVTNLFLFQPR
jgi:hypothetical protein